MALKQVRPQALLLDCDGVIVESKACHHGAWSEACVALWDIPAASVGAIPSGMASNEIAAVLAARAGHPEDAAALYEEKLARLLAGPLPPLLPGAKELLTWATSEGLPTGVVSNAHGAYVRWVVSSHQLPTRAVFGHEDATNPKPAPDLYLAMATTLGIENIPSHVWIFEDSATGLQAAQASGMVAVGIATYLSHSRLLGHDAQRVYSTLAVALEVLQKHA